MEVSKNKTKRIISSVLRDIINNVRTKFHQWYFNLNATGNQKLFYFLKDRKRNTRLVSLYMEAINKLDTNSFVIKDIHFYLP